MFFMDDIARTLKALGDPTRLRILCLLRQGELCVCDLMAALDLPQSTVSRHLSMLRGAGWLDARKGGAWTYYRLRVEPGPLQAELLEPLLIRLSVQPQAAVDTQKLADHLRTKKPDSCS